MCTSTYTYTHPNTKISYKFSYKVESSQPRIQLTIGSECPYTHWHTVQFTTVKAMDLFLELRTDLKYHHGKYCTKDNTKATVPISPSRLIFPTIHQLCDNEPNTLFRGICFLLCKIRTLRLPPSQGSYVSH